MPKRSIIILITAAVLFNASAVVLFGEAVLKILSKKEYEKTEQKFTPVDLSSAANRGFYDEVEGDGVGGWTDQGANDMRQFALRGETRFLNIPFVIIEPERNGGRSCIVLRGKNNKNFPVAVEISVNNKAAGIYFIHCSAWSADIVGRYRLVYESGEEYVAELHHGEEIFDWWGKQMSDIARPVWTGANSVTDTMSVYLYALANPYPAKKIKNIVAETSGDGSYLMLLAVTLTDTGPYLPEFGKVQFTGKRFEPGDKNVIKKLSSPDGNIKINFILSNGMPFYEVFYKDETIIKPSSLGFSFKTGKPLQDNFKIVKTAESKFDETWAPAWGTVSQIRNNYNELTVKLKETTTPKREMHLIFRAYNDGMGFRYRLPEQEDLKEVRIISEETYFRLAGNHTVWWIPDDYNSHEYKYKKTGLDRVRGVNLPLTMKVHEGLFISLHEANLTDYAALTLVSVEGEENMLKAELVPRYDGVKVKAKTPLVTPWRTIQISTRAASLIESNLILNLNEPCAIKDVSWIKPMKYMGIWWGMHIGKETWVQGDKHGATTENAKRYIDFASKHGIPALLIEGWNKSWEDWGKKGAFKFTEPYPDFNPEEVVRYGKEKGVYIIGHHETGSDVLSYEEQMDAAFAFYNKLGVLGVKTGYVGNIIPKGEHHHGQWMVNHYQRVVEKAAEYKIVLDVHEPVHDTGISRTYPNMMTREGVRGMEYNAWSEGNPPEHTTIIPFTRMLSGPLDYTPGIFDITFDKYKNKERVYTTLVKQLALYVILFSPLQMAADLPENYEKHLDAFEFIEKVPCSWDETKVLNGSIGDFVTIARKKSGSWYIGSITDEEPRTFELPLVFLDGDKKYSAQIYSDAPDADWEKNPAAYKIKKVLVESKDILTAPLAPGGGYAVILTSATAEDVDSLQKN